MPLTMHHLTGQPEYDGAKTAMQMVEKFLRYGGRYGETDKR